MTSYFKLGNHYCEIGKRKCPLARKTSNRPFLRDFPRYCKTQCKNQDKWDRNFVMSMEYKLKKLDRNREIRENNKLTLLLKSFEIGGDAYVVEIRRTERGEEGVNRNSDEG